MTDRELMQMALDGLNDSEASDARYEAIQALRDRLAQPYPVRWERRSDGKTGLTNVPPKREWVGFTHEELAWLNEALNLGGRLAVIEAIEAKLKEKNT
jgi:hypothetical protein